MCAEINECVHDEENAKDNGIVCEDFGAHPVAAQNQREDVWHMCSHMYASIFKQQSGGEDKRTMETMLLQSARLAVRIKSEYFKLKKDPEAKYYCYVLLLKNSKFYVGCSDNIYARLLDHYAMSPSSAVWVRKHGPVQRVVEVMRNCSRDVELYKTMEYMSMFGWENVRGASFCRSEMAAPPPPLASFIRSSGDPLEYIPRKEVDEICIEVSKLAIDYLKTLPKDNET